MECARLTLINNRHVPKGGAMISRKERVYIPREKGESVNEECKDMHKQGYAGLHLLVRPTYRNTL